MSIPADLRDATLYVEGLVPLTIGVTGHRDIVPAEAADTKREVQRFFTELRRRFPDRPLQLLSPLADGADRLVAEVALELRVRLVVPLPMPRDIYVSDFETAASRGRFEYLCSRAETVLELPVIHGVSLECLAADAEARSRQYAQLGVFLCAHSHILLALWDGKTTMDVGGTSQVVRFHHDDVMAGYAASESITRQLLTSDESDLVYHIVVSRDRVGGEPADGLEAVSASWFTNDREQPRTPTLPPRYAETFERTSQFNREARDYYHSIIDECYPLVDDATDSGLPSEIQRINLFFCVADWLAIFYQKRVQMALRVTHTLAFVMGMTFILYSDFEARRYFIETFFVCFVIAFGVQTITSRKRWHSKYLEYRALAEGLRVQFYWAAAGVTHELSTKFSHDNFLQKQDPELGWIQNVMRVAGIGCDTTPNLDPADLEYVIKEWIGSESGGGQLGYYRTKARDFAGRAQRLGALAQIVGFVVTGLVLLTAIVDSVSLRNMLFVALGTLLLLYSVRQSFAHRVAEKEIVKQYEFMRSIFGNARRRIDAAASDTEKRHILRALGEAAIDEHAEWIFLHRDRSPDPGGLWRMES